MGMHRFPLGVPFHLKQCWWALLLAVAWLLYIFDLFYWYFPILLYLLLNCLLNWLIYMQFCSAECWLLSTLISQTVLKNQWLYMLSMLHFWEVVAIRPVLYKVIDSHLLYSSLFIQVTAFKVLWVFIIRWDIFISDAQLKQTALVWMIFLWDEKRVWFKRSRAIFFIRPFNLILVKTCSLDCGGIGHCDWWANFTALCRYDCPVHLMRQGWALDRPSIMADFWADRSLSSLKLCCLALMSWIRTVQHLFFPVSRWTTESCEDWEFGYGYILLRRIRYATNRLLSGAFLSSIPTLLICNHSIMLHRSRIIQNFVQGCYICACQIFQVFSLAA